MGEKLGTGVGEREGMGVGVGEREMTFGTGAVHLEVLKNAGGNGARLGS